MTFDEWFVRNNDGDDSGKDIAEYAWKAGAASRDAEVVSLTNQRDYEYVRAENAEQERDQLREQIASLKDELRQISTAIDDVRLDLTNTAAELIMEMKEQLSSRDAEIAELVSALRLWKLASNNSEESELDDMACYCVPMPLFCDADEATEAVLDKVRKP